MTAREWTYTEYTYGNGYQDKLTGVTIEWEYHAGGYSWDLWALVSKKVGDETLYAAYIDSGCSCVSPYEKSPDKYSLAWTPNLKEAASSLSRSIKDDDHPGDDGWKPDQKVTTLTGLSRAVRNLR